MPSGQKNDANAPKMCSNRESHPAPSDFPAGMSVIITLDWPPAVLFPNRRLSLHWSRSSGAKKKYREAAFWAAKSAIGRRTFAAPPQIEVAFFPPDARARDDDGMIGAFKNARDGIAAAIGFDDATWRPSYSCHDPLRPYGKIVVVLTAMDRQ